MLRLLILYLSLFLLNQSNALADNQHLSIHAGDTEITVERFPAKGKRLFIWLPSEAGRQGINTTLATQLVAQGIETWLADLFEANFLPIVESSMEQIPVEQIGALIDAAYSKTRKDIYLVTTGRGAIPFLRGARHWQMQATSQQGLRGAILISPKFFVETPDPGVESRLMPIVESTNLPLFIIQPKLSPWVWKLPLTVAALEGSGSDVFVQRLPRVRDRFHFRADATAREDEVTASLPALLRHASQLLNSLPQQKRTVATNVAKPPPPRVGKKESQLQAYRGHPIPPALRLKDLQGNSIDLQQLRGQVVLLNFWASWCPPCVYEMPSMARLMTRLKGQPFTILAVNMAEDKSTIRNFIRTKVKVNFPIIMDKDGAALKRWQVFAFPTSYVIDRQGKIRYALFGGIEWDKADIVGKITALIKESN